MKNFILITCIFSLISINAISQKVITNYFGYTNKISEQYQVNAQGVKNGFYKAYHREGQLVYSYNFKNGKENGLCIDYAGTRNYNSIYCFGKPLLERVMKDGELQSEKYYGCDTKTNFIIYTKKLIAPDVFEKTEYFQSGKLKAKYNESSNYTSAKGDFIQYFENGKIAEKGQIDNGRCKRWIGYYENGDTSYIADYELGIEANYKKFNPKNVISFVSKADTSFEKMERMDYDTLGNLYSKKVIQAYPFKYECSSVPQPTSWKELLARKIMCGGDSYNPFDPSNCYVSLEILYKPNGDILSKTETEIFIISAYKKIKVSISSDDVAQWNNNVNYLALRDQILSKLLDLKKANESSCQKNSLGQLPTKNFAIDLLIKDYALKFSENLFVEIQTKNSENKTQAVAPFLLSPYFKADIVELLNSKVKNEQLMAFMSKYNLSPYKDYGAYKLLSDILGSKLVNEYWGKTYLDETYIIGKDVRRSLLNEYSTQETYTLISKTKPVFDQTFTDSGYGLFSNVEKVSDFLKEVEALQSKLTPVIENKELTFEEQLKGKTDINEIKQILGL